MAKILIVYYSRTGNTEKMAERVAKGVTKAGAEATVKAVGETKADELKDYDGIILGSPTYYGTMAAEIKQLLDDSVAFHGQLAGKVGGAFSSSANMGGGNETTVMDMLKALLMALLEPTQLLRDHESTGDFTARLALLEDLKSLPFGAVWDYCCLTQDVPVGHQWVGLVNAYEEKVLSERN